MPDTPGQRRTIRAADFLKNVQLRERPTFGQLIGFRFGQVLLWFIVGLTGLFVLAWWFSRPTLEQAQSVAAAGSDSDVLQVLKDLRQAHFDQFRELFQLVVTSGLVPLFTLVAGYAFGSREGQRARSDEGADG